MTAVNSTVAEKDEELRRVHARLASAHMQVVELHSGMQALLRVQEERLATKDQYAQELMRVGVMLEQQCHTQATRIQQVKPTRRDAKSPTRSPHYRIARSAQILSGDAVLGAAD
jgi:hypothetical protein